MNLTQISQRTALDKIRQIMVDLESLSININLSDPDEKFDKDCLKEEIDKIVNRSYNKSY